MIAAGPAATAAFRAPKSQPEPMIEPTLANSSPMTPTWRLSSVCPDEVDWVSVDMCTFSFRGSGRPADIDRTPLFNLLFTHRLGGQTPTACAIMRP